MRAIVQIALALTLILSSCGVIRGNKPLGYKNHSNAPQTIYDIKQFYFTPVARAAISHIPCVDGPHIGKSYVLGVNFYTDLVGAFTFHGFERKCVVNLDYVRKYGPRTIIHEYLHHLDDMTRDGEGDFISYVYFDCAYEKLSRDKEWRVLYRYSLAGYNKFTDTFGVGWRSEQLAYVGAWMAYMNDGPEYMWDVFKRVLRRR